MTPRAHHAALRAAAAVAALASCTPKPSSPEGVVPEDPRRIAACIADTRDAEKNGDMTPVLGCCRTLSDHFGQEGVSDLDWATRGACCEALDWRVGGACSPWGPPTPPALERGMAPRGSTPLDLRESAGRERIPVDPPPASLRGAAIATWRARMVNEYGSAVVFEALARQLRAAGVDPRIVDQVAGFADEERHHGVLCGAVVESLGGRATGELPAPPPFPLHPDVSPLEGALRNLISVACLSETVAVALIGAEREDMPEGPLRDLLTQIWRDEIGHARTGWRLVGEILAAAPELEPSLGRYLAVALAHLEAHELEHLPEFATFGPGGASWGLCDGSSARALLYDTVHQVILPGLERLGLPAVEAWSRRAA